MLLVLCVDRSYIVYCFFALRFFRAPEVSEDVWYRNDWKIPSSVVWTPPWSPFHILFPLSFVSSFLMMMNGFVPLVWPLEKVLFSHTTMRRRIFFCREVSEVRFVSSSFFHPLHRTHPFFRKMYFLWSSVLLFYGVNFSWKQAGDFGDFDTNCQRLRAPMKSTVDPGPSHSPNQIKSKLSFWKPVLTFCLFLPFLFTASLMASLHQRRPEHTG